MMRWTSRRLLQTALESSTESSSSVSERYYKCSVSSRLSPDLASCWRCLQPDPETRDFLADSQRKSANVCLQLFYAAVYIFLCAFLSYTDINGLLEKGKMFVFSTSHLATLFHSFPRPSFILDIGSGDGHVTDKLRSYFGPSSTIHTTEASAVMRRILRRKGYKVLDVERWHEEREFSYDLIACLNVLDRCDCPHTMLRQIHSKLRDGGVLLLAVVFPYRPFVEKGARQAPPTQRLLVRGDGWEEGVSDLVTKVLRPLGFSLLSVSKLPYLCQGDLHNNWFVLQDIVLVLSKDSTPPITN